MRFTTEDKHLIKRMWEKIRRKMLTFGMNWKLNIKMWKDNGPWRR